MSFILDALKKSEAERQRQSGPTLLEVRVTAPRRRYPLWALIVGALLLVNVIVLVVFLLRKPTPAPAASVTPPPAAVSTPAPVSAPPVAAAPVNTLPSAVAPPAEPATQSPDSGATDSSNPADDVPAVPPERAPRAAPARSDGIDYASLPSSSDVSNLPDLRLDLHVYTDRASDRYALINMHKVREGDTLPEGPKVLAITPGGVALDYRGQNFMLRPQ